MKLNMGSFDRTLRVVVALVIAVLFVTKIISGVLGIVLLVLGGIFLLTSFTGICPLYLPFGISTRGKSASKT